MLAFLGFLLTSSAVEARTWRVVRDGNGDYTTIQPAIVAASPGDTISIGPGEYTECQTVRLPGWTWSIDVYVYATKDDLTIIGDDPESVIIGPETATFSNCGPKGIVAVQSCDDLHVEGIRIRNVYSGIYMYLGALEAVNCCLDGCDDGVSLYADDGGVIDSCRFDGQLHTGITIWALSNDVSIVHSAFNYCSIGIAVEGATNIVVSDCEILGDGSLHNTRVGVQYSTYATGSIMNCHIENCYSYGISSLVYSEICLSGNEIVGGQVNIHLSGSSTVRGSNNLLGGGTYATILNDGRMIDMQGNHILNAGGKTVWLYYGFDSPPDAILDMRNNYWGTREPEQIGAWIIDGNDDPNIHGFVLYEPFADGPVGTEPATMGRVKAMYR